jgi:hypothetical protein
LAVASAALVTLMATSAGTLTETSMVTMVATEKIAAATMISEYYIVLEDGKNKCKLCGDPDKAKVYGSTISSHNLFKHLKATHNLKISNTTSLSLISNDLTEEQKADITDAYMKWIVTDLQPFTTSSCKAFRRFIFKLNPWYNIPSRQTLKTLVMHHYKLEKLTISQYLQNISGAICLTTDIWTSKPMDSYCGITAHFIDESWKPCHTWGC